jgi:hypothetical protein
MNRQVDADRRQSFFAARPLWVPKVNPREAGAADSRPCPPTCRPPRTCGRARSASGSGRCRTSPSGSADRGCHGRRVLGTGVEDNDGPAGAINATESPGSVPAVAAGAVVVATWDELAVDPPVAPGGS